MIIYHFLDLRKKDFTHNRLGYFKVTKATELHDKKGNPYWEIWVMGASNPFRIESKIVKVME